MLSRWLHVFFAPDEEINVLSKGHLHFLFSLLLLFFILFKTDVSKIFIRRYSSISDIYPQHLHTSIYTINGHAILFSLWTQVPLSKSRFMSTIPIEMCLHLTLLLKSSLNFTILLYITKKVNFIKWEQDTYSDGTVAH